MLPTRQSTRLSLICSISTPRNSIETPWKFWNWLEPNWHRRSHDPPELRSQLHFTERSKTCPLSLPPISTCTFEMPVPLLTPCRLRIALKGRQFTWQRNLNDSGVRPAATKRWAGEHLSLKRLEGTLKFGKCPCERFSLEWSGCHFKVKFVSLNVHKLILWRVG